MAFLAPFPMALLVGGSTCEDRGPRPGFLQLTVGPRAVGLGRGSLVLRRWVGAVCVLLPDHATGQEPFPCTSGTDAFSGWGVAGAGRWGARGPRPACWVGS